MKQTAKQPSTRQNGTHTTTWYPYSWLSAPALTTPINPFSKRSKNTTPLNEFQRDTHRRLFVRLPLLKTSFLLRDSREERHTQ